MKFHRCYPPGKMIWSTTWKNPLLPSGNNHSNTTLA